MVEIADKTLTHWNAHLDIHYLSPLLEGKFHRGKHPACLVLSGGPGASCLRGGGFVVVTDDLKEASEGWAFGSQFAGIQPIPAGEARCRKAACSHLSPQEQSETRKC